MADWQKWQTFLRETPLPIRRTRLWKIEKYSAKPANLPKKERKKLKYIIYILLLLLLFPLVPQRVSGFGAPCIHMSIAFFETHVYIEKWHIFRTFEHAILAGISAIKNGWHKIFVFFAHKNACQSFLMAGFGRNGRNFWQVLFSCLAEISAKKFLHTDNSAHIFCDAYTTSIVFWKETVYHYSTVSFKETMDTVHTHFVHTAFRGHEKFYTTDNRLQNMHAVISSTVFPPGLSEKLWQSLLAC